MPVPAQIRGLFGDDDQVEGPRRDRVVTPGADVLLASLVGLHGSDGHVGMRAHTIAAIAAAPANTIIRMSTRFFSCFRNGLKPTP